MDGDKVKLAQTISFKILIKKYICERDSFDIDSVYNDLKNKHGWKRHKKELWYKMIDMCVVDLLKSNIISKRDENIYDVHWK